MKKTQNQSRNIEQFQPYLDQMADSSLKAYITGRVIDQIDWYDQKSCDKQSRYKGWTIATIILNGIIPVAVLLPSWGIVTQVLIAALSSATGIISAAIALTNYKGLWIQYRLNCEALKSTLYRFFLRVGEFRSLDESALNDMLVDSCESLLTKEFQLWGTVTNDNTVKLANKKAE